MRWLAIPLCGLACATLVVATPAPAAAAPKVLNIELKWTPKDAPNLPSLDMTGGLRSLTIEPFVDKREKPAEATLPNQIGENPEDKVPVTTRSDVPQFLHEVITRELKTMGLELRESAGDLTMKSELLQFWIRDSGSYQATVRLKVTLQEGGKELWTGIVQGIGENWGRSLKPINYTETISGAVVQWMTNLLQTPEFRNALKKGKS